MRHPRTVLIMMMVLVAGLVAAWGSIGRGDDDKDREKEKAGAVAILPRLHQ